MKEFNLRQASREDTPIIFELIKDLAVYEKMLDEVVATEELLEDHIFNKKRVEVLIAEEDNKPIGFCLFFYNFSTFVGRSGIYLEDIYIKPEYRSNGYGKIIFKELAKIAVERNCGRMEWVCLDWNKSAIEFYKKMGAVPMDEWTIYRLAGESLKEVAEKED
ncbi:GNAT family N-acetyltransferase [Miniphocaeibacter halophilus]|uniref:GNAT family N-acetyltransferase n=1 Tax=Miniphocaeibacter halophilus TaxID=2931922 RepID=A0AC61N971_9FIRM|nr:GNAT family N-acetyltransferase [Miniphocaeibacter halophilus]QQK08363.1 GNAT family N-acetyltransferase [Miniphocaeibacter halophilus]